MNRANNPYDYIADPAKGRPLFNCDLYYGIPDLDPQIPANQISVSVQQEDGTVVPVSQPIETGAGGVPMYNGSPAIVLISQDTFSFKAIDRLGGQVYYQENADATLGSSSVVGQLDNYAAVRALNSSNFNQVSVAGHTDEGDGGAGIFYADSSDMVTADNGITVLVDAGGMRWKREYDGAVKACWAGDDDQAVQKAIDSIAYGVVEVGFHNTYTFGAGVVCKSDVAVHINDGTTVDASGMPANSIAFNWAGSEGAEYPLAANSTGGTKSVFLSPANLSASGIVAGDWIRIASDAVFDSLRTNSKIGEMAQVESVNGGTGEIILEAVAADSYLTADGATVSKVTFCTGAAITGGGRILGSNIPADNHAGVKFELCHSPRHSDVSFKQITGRCLWFQDSIFLSSTNAYFEDLLPLTSGYGISVDNACQDGVITGAKSVRARHLFTTNNSTATKGIPRRITFTDFVVYATNPATSGSAGPGDAVDTHAAAEDIHIKNGTIYGGDGQGVNIECRSGSLVNVTVYSSGDNGVHIANYTDRDADWFVDGVCVYGAGDAGVKFTPVYADFASLNIGSLYVSESSNYPIWFNGSLFRFNSVSAEQLYAENGANEIYIEGIDSGSIGSVLSYDPALASSHGLRIKNSRRLTVEKVNGRLASSATGSMVYLNSTAASDIDSVIIRSVNGESPSAVSSRGVRIDNNATNVTIGQDCDFSAFTTPITWGTGSGHKGGALYGSATYNPPSVGPGSSATTTVSVTSASIGDSVTLGFTNSLAGMVLTGYVSSANTVTAVFSNPTAGAIDLASGTLYAKVVKI